jgi:hypothetical protein
MVRGEPLQESVKASDCGGDERSESGVMTPPEVESSYPETNPVGERWQGE